MLSMRVGADLHRHDGDRERHVANAATVGHERLAAFIVWAVPAVVLGLIVLFKLTDRPAQARWLKDDERAALEAELARERSAHGVAPHMTVGQALRNPAVILLALTNFLVTSAHYGIEAFQPTILTKWTTWASPASRGPRCRRSSRSWWSADHWPGTDRGRALVHTCVPRSGARMLILTMLVRAVTRSRSCSSRSP
jgi:hypothetical protein